MGEDVCSLGVTSDTDVQFSDQLAQLEAFLSDHRERLELVGRNGRVLVHVGWSPRVAQDSIYIGRSLMDLFSELRIELYLDTYVDG